MNLKKILLHAGILALALTVIATPALAEPDATPTENVTETSVSTETPDSTNQPDLENQDAGDSSDANVIADGQGDAVDPALEQHNEDYWEGYNAAQAEITAAYNNDIVIDANAGEYSSDSNNAYIIQKDNDGWKIVGDLGEASGSIDPTVIQRNSNGNWFVPEKYEAIYYTDDENLPKEEDTRGLLTLTKNENHGWSINYSLYSKNIVPYVFIIVATIVVDILLMAAAVILLDKKRRK